MNRELLRKSPQEPTILPLTKCDDNGSVYQRTGQVNKQIIESLLLEPSTLIDRAGQKDFKAIGYLQEECLIYLIRKFHSENQVDLVNKLVECLIHRCQRQIHGQISFALASTYVEECYNDVIGEVFGQIADLNSDRADFAQVRFKTWLDCLTFNVLRRYWKKQREDSITDAYDKDETDHDGKDFAELPEALRDKTMPQDLQLICIEALNTLNAKERMVFLMRYYWEWEIENQNSNVMTISKYFNVDQRTIRNWLTSAKTKLQRWARR